MSLPENAQNVRNLGFAKMKTDALLRPHKLWTPSDVLARPSPVPASAVVYAWFFASCPQGVPTEGIAVDRICATLRPNFLKAPERSEGGWAFWFHLGRLWPGVPESGR